jgi:uroporphyrinogen-III synthase
MLTRPIILVTGPVERLEEWCTTAEQAGWCALPYPLVRIEPSAAVVKFDGHDALVVTSANALACVPPDALHLPYRSCVGTRCLEALQAADPRGPILHAPSSDRLLVEISRTWVETRRILFPRGDLAAAVPNALRELCHEVDDPIVYRTVELAPRTPPASQAVFLASPSAVRAWFACEPAPRDTIAIGPTTLAAMHGRTPAATFVLDRPEPEALRRLLSSALQHHGSQSQRDG